MAQKKNFLLRMDSDLWDDLQVWASDELRSINSQIEYLLKQAVKIRRRTTDPDLRKDATKSNATKIT
ncbi:MAG: hypothetical protein AAB019_07395 [Planctomycetota bacterium]